MQSDRPSCKAGNLHPRHNPAIAAAAGKNLTFAKHFGFLLDTRAGLTEFPRPNLIGTNPNQRLFIACVE
jgi:hypothetical protein